MSTVTIDEAQNQLKRLIAAMKPGEEMVITEDDRPVARLVAEPRRDRRRGSSAP